VKYWAWLIFLGAGTAATYLIVYDPDTKTTGPSGETKSEIIKQEQEDADSPPSLGGSSSEVILPLDGGNLPGRKGPASAGPEDKEEEYVLDEDDGLERQLALGDLPPPRPRRPSKRAAPTEAATGGAASGSPAAFVSTPPPTPAAASAASPSGLGGSSAATNFGTFPALPATAVSPSSSSSASSGRTVFSPAPKNASPAAGPKTEKQVKDVKSDAVPREGTVVSPPDELIKPVANASPETQKMNMTIEADPEAIWRETMQIPAGFTGLSLTPKSVTALPPPASNIASSSETQPTAATILGATLNSGFDSSDKVLFEIQKDCGDPAQNPNCDPHQLPPGAPVLSDYFYDGKAQQGDLNLDTKDAFEIGTVVIGTEKDAATGKEISQVEVAFHILPGFAPGKYQVLLGKPAKLIGSFEVVAGTPVIETATMYRSAAPGTKPAPKTPPTPK